MTYEKTPDNKIQINPDVLILDACCGGRKFWFNKTEPHTVYVDKRRETLKINDSSKTTGFRMLDVNPDYIADFTNLPFEDETFWHVVFDPPHLESLGEHAWMAQMYGRLLPGWETTIQAGFKECMRVLKTYGTLNFKWNEHDVKLSYLLELIKQVGHEPLYGHTTGRQSKTVWMSFVKTNTINQQ